MSTTTTASVPATTGMTATAEDPFDLDVSIIESAPVIPELLRSTSDNCGGGMCTLRCDRDLDCPEDMLCEHETCFFGCASDEDCADGVLQAVLRAWLYGRESAVPKGRLIACSAFSARG